MRTIHHYANLICLLVLVRLTFAQTVQTSVTCLSDGQCVTETGEEAVCGKIDEAAQVRLPTVGGKGDEYVIRINLSEQLPEDPVELAEEPVCDPNKGKCPAAPRPTVTTAQEPEAPGKGGAAEPTTDPLAIFAASNNNNRNPFLGWVGCVTPAFPKACQYCCFRTALRRGRRDQSREVEKSESDNDEEVCERCEAKEGSNFSSEGSLVLARASNAASCSSQPSLGFRRSPNDSFFRLCNRRARNLCARGFQRCVR